MSRWQHSPTGRLRYWTRERVMEGLRLAAAELPSPLPCSDSAYNALKKGHDDWPTSARVLEYFGGMARGWLSVGIPLAQVSLRNLDWTRREDLYLLEHAGNKTLRQIAKDLGRTYQAVRVRLGSKGHGLTARGNQGYLSAAEIARHYRCPYHRVRDLLQAGTLKGRLDAKRNCWRVDPAALTPSVEALLRAPKTRSYKNSPPDVGDYYQRYGLKRRLVGGKVRVVLAAS